MNQDFLRWRNIETPCTKCGGRGSTYYASTSTWRGGMGGAMVTSDVCDHCWGSGDEHEHWTDLRALRNSREEQAKRLAADYLASGCGVDFRSVRPGLREIVVELRKLERGRKQRPEGFYKACVYLANTLERMCDAKDRELSEELARKTAAT